MPSKNATFPVPEAVYHHTKGKTLKKYTNKEHRFLSHILVSTIKKVRKGGTISVPVPFRDLRGVNWEPFTEGRISFLSVTPYDRANSRCREFRFTFDILDSFLDDVIEAYTSTPSPRIVNIFTGKVIRKIQSNQTKDSKGITEPELICKAMKAIQPRQFNRTAVIDYINDEKTKLNSLKGLPDYQEEFLRFMNKVTAWMTAENQKPKHIHGDIWAYKAAYYVQMSGRIGEINGGLQSASRALKTEAYKAIPDLFNYDLKSSQILCLIQQFEDAGLDTRWLVTYRDDPIAKTRFSRTIGINEDTWKECLMAVIMGSSPKENKGIHEKLRDFCKDHSHPASYADALLKTFNRYTSDLQPPLRQWHYYILQKYPKGPNGYSYRGKRYLKKKQEKYFV